MELLPFQHHILQGQWANYKANKNIFRLKVEGVFVSTEESRPRETLLVKGIEFSSNKDPLLSRSRDKGYIPTAKTHWSILEIIFSWKSEDRTLITFCSVSIVYDPSSHSQCLRPNHWFQQSLIPFPESEAQISFSTILVHNYGTRGLSKWLNVKSFLIFIVQDMFRKTLPEA